MGAMHNDANRCQFMYADDRRCRNLIEAPGKPLCYYHNHPRDKQPVAEVPSDPRAIRAFFDWLAAHPLDSATHVSQALNQLFLLVVGGCVSLRRADALIRMARLLKISVPDVWGEFNSREIRRRHWPQGDSFLKQIQPLLEAAVPREPEAAKEEEKAGAALEPLAVVTAPENPAGRSAA